MSASFEHLPIVISQDDLNYFGFCVVCNDCNIIVDTRKICTKCIDIKPKFSPITRPKYGDLIHRGCRRRLSY
jgi:hypothetical protein